MNHFYPQVIACLLLSFSGYSFCNAQSGPEFLNCTDSIISLCVQDQGVRLPDNNQIFLGEEHPDASRGSVHVTRSITISGGCGNVLDYKVELLLEDSATVVILQPWTAVSLDTSGEATLFFDTSLSPDSVINQSGISYSSNCTSNHTIIWTVIDSCNTEVVCSGKLYLFDCASPIPGPSGGPYTASLPSGCFLTLFAKDFETGSLDDRLSFDQLLFSFEQDSYTPNQTILCQWPFYVELPWSIWIADKGEDYNCNGHIAWNERNKVEQTFTIVFHDDPFGLCCEPDFDSTFTGQITTIHNNVGVNLVSVTLNQPGTVHPTYITSTDGTYSFKLNLSGEETTIIPEKNIGHKNGVTTLDLVRIQKHLLGRQLFTSLDQYISADVNNSQTVSAIDLIELRKLILGVYTELPNSPSWKFAAKDPGFVDSLGGIFYAPSISFTSQLPVKPDFYGIKIGDVNYSANPSASNSILPRSIPFIEWTTIEKIVKQGESVMVPLSISESASIAGFQFTVEFPGFEFVALHPGAINVVDDNFALFEDQLTMSWFDESNIDVSPEDELFIIELKATRAGSIGQSLSINSDITEAELYLENEETFLPVLTFQNENIEDGLEIVSCAPNPWKEETIVNFYLPEEDKVTFTLFDVSGREVYTASKFLNEGSQQFQLKASGFSARGVMFFEINNSKERVFQKMIVLE